MTALVNGACDCVNVAALERDSRAAIECFECVLCDSVVVSSGTPEPCVGSSGRVRVVTGASIVGAWLEVCWRYWRAPTEEEIAKGEKRKKIGVPIWCEGEVMAIANGTTDKAAPQCKSALAKGALRIRWPEDKDRKEKESYSWHMFQDEDWRKEGHLGWRYAASELQKRAECAAAAGEAGSARKKAHTA